VGKARRWLGFLWAAPTTLVGLLFAILGGARPYAVRPALTLHFIPWGRWTPWGLFFGAGHFAATTFGHVTVIARHAAENRVTIRHERQHTLQCWRWGPLFLPIYLAQWAAHGFRYSRIPLEHAAYNAQEKPDAWG
jgi:hypothetical protein